jgi:pyruvate dehydrogenase E2 component (dihydrolipoamide acetyltransferase)
MPDVVMPRLSDAMEEATIVRWLKTDGDVVAVGEELVEIETDKATMPYEAEHVGVLRIVAAEGETVALGALIARIGADDAAPVAARAPALAAVAAVAGPASSARVDAPVANRTGAGDPPRTRIAATPVARRVAKELGIDLAGLIGSGPQGRITKRDVRVTETPVVAVDALEVAPASAPGPAPAGVTHQELSRVQQVIARRMTESKATVPDFTLTAGVDMEAAGVVRAQLRELLRDDEATPSFNDLVIKACAFALRRHPRANGSYRDGRFELHDDINVGFAVAAADALLVPVVGRADAKGLAAITADTRALSGKVRDGSLTASDLAGGTFTVSNLGMFGITSFTAVVNPPQAAILAVGAIEPRVVVRDGEIVVRRTMTLTLTCDHRILYGADAARFLGEIRSALEAPLSMLL